MSFKYLFGAILAFPLLPILYVQGQKIRKNIPSLPDAKGPEGEIKSGTNRKISLLAIGESTIAGVGVETHQEGFTGTLAQELAAQLNCPVSWKVYAKSGYTAKKVAESIVPSIPDQRADLVVVGLGGNDAFKLSSPIQWRKDIASLIGKLKKKFPGAPIAFTNMPPIKTFPAFTPLIKMTIGNLVEILGESLTQEVDFHKNVFYNNRIITLEDWTERLKVNAQPSEFYSDGVHPSKLTYQVWARDFAGFLLQASQIASQLSP